MIFDVWEWTNRGKRIIKLAERILVCNLKCMTERGMQDP
jgi:hypothetical protein